MSGMEPERKSGIIPITMLSGFLGAGKTTLLKHILEDGSTKTACLVNDMASINIDAKLVRNTKGRQGEGDAGTSGVAADMVELQNGCACCSAAEELFPSFEQILALGERRGEPFERIIMENSGIAEPQNIRDSFAEAIAEDHPLMKKIELANLITIVDSATFIREYCSRAPLAMRPDLGEGGNMRPVVDLLVEQIECADVVVLNKADMVDQKAMQSLLPVIASLNPIAKVLSCSHGQIPLDIVKQPGIIAKLNVEGQHRTSVAAVKKMQEKAHSHAHDEHNHDHKAEHHNGQDHHHSSDKHHDHGHGHNHGNGHSHNHDHGHGHNHEHGHGHDHKHGHGHDHKHGHHEGHSHAHGHHGHDHSGHDHSHDHGPNQSTAAKRFGIESFVYQRRRPFHTIRLRDLVLKWIPAATNTALDGEAPGEGYHPIKKVLRSKGFTWLSNNHMVAFYWSHAGQHFELREEGDWWAAVEGSDWPVDQEMRNVVLGDFEGDMGDRRQEIVFIGANMEQDEICKQLDEALLTDSEMDQYTRNWSQYPDPPHPMKPAVTNQAI